MIIICFVFLSLLSLSDMWGLWNYRWGFEGKFKFFQFLSIAFVISTELIGWMLYLEYLMNISTGSNLVRNVNSMGHRNLNPLKNNIFFYQSRRSDFKIRNANPIKNFFWEEFKKIEILTQ